MKNIFNNIGFSIKKKKVNKFLIIIIIFIFSLIISKHYTQGDQLNYIHFYNQLREDRPTILSAFKQYFMMLGSQEPGYFFIVYICSYFINKNILMSILNTCISIIIINWLEKNNVSKLIYILIFTNFYLLVLFFSAERLKIAIFFILLSFLTSGVKYAFLSGLAFITQVQSILLLLCNLLWKESDSIKIFFKKLIIKKKIYTKIYLLLLIIFLSFILRKHIIHKLNAYKNIWGGIFSVIKPLALLVLTLIYARDKISAFISHIPLIIASFFLGEQRIVLFSYFVFMFYALKIKRGANIGVFIVSLYFSLKGILFLRSIFLWGNGFINILF
jgi:hypothetical protein